jgi:hypothetical protein
MRERVNATPAEPRAPLVEVLEVLSPRLVRLVCGHLETAEHQAVGARLPCVRCALESGVGAPTAPPPSPSGGVPAPAHPAASYRAAVPGQDRMERGGHDRAEAEGGS